MTNSIFMSLPLLVRENSVVPMGETDDEDLVGARRMYSHSICFRLPMASSWLHTPGERRASRRLCFDVAVKGQ